MRVLVRPLLIRSIAVIIPLACVVVLPTEASSMLFVCLGLAHLTLAFWYQKDAAKWNPRKYALAAAAFFLLLFLGLNLPFTAVVLTLATIFTFHFILDEAYFFKLKHSLFTTLESLPFLVLYIGLMFDTFLGTSLLMPSIVLTVIALVAYLLLSIVKKRTPNALSGIYAFWGLIGLTAYVAFASLPLSLPPTLWFLILTVVHYVIWYGEFWKKVETHAERRVTFVWRSLGVNVFFFVFAYLWLSGLAPIGFLVYTPLFFYIWSFMHISTSLRSGEVKASFSW